MPFPVVNGKTAIENIQILVDFAGVFAPPHVKQAGEDLFKQVDIVSTRLYYDVQELKAWRATLDQTYTPTDPFSEVTNA